MPAYAEQDEAAAESVRPCRSSFCVLMRLERELRELRELNTPGRDKRFDGYLYDFV